MKITLAWGKQNYNIRTSISAFYHHFATNWSYHGFCRLSSGSANNPSIFLFPRTQEQNMKEKNGWKNKSHHNWTLQIHLSRFVRKTVCPVSKNAIEEWFFFTFNIGQPCKQYNFQMCLRDNLVPRMLEMAFQSFQISKFSGGACPQTPQRPLVHTVGYSSLTSCLLQILLKPLCW